MSTSGLLIPVQKIITRHGRFLWPKQITLASPAATDILPLQQLATELRQNKFNVNILRNAFGPATVRIRRNNSKDLPESYRLVITPSCIEIFASDNAGAYYAIQTLRDLLKIHPSFLPTLTIEDWPSMKRRGVYHDCSRGKVPKLSTLKALVERLARWKINELQLYIENVFCFQRHSKISVGYSPFHAKELLELQDHCRLHHVRLVGSLASLGHMEKILALPTYQHLAELPGFRGFTGGTTLCPTDPKSIKLIAELYEEFIPLFTADDFNVCGDEPWELGQGRSQRHVQRNGIGQVYLDYLKKLYRLCEKHNKRMNLWADVVLNYPESLKQLPQDIVLLNWEYEARGPRIKKTKYIAEQRMAQMVCPGTSSWLTHGSRLPNAMDNIANFARSGLRYGSEGLLNTDWGDQGHRNFLGISMHGFAHGAAHGWNHKKVDDSRFTKIFCRHWFSKDHLVWAKTIQTLGQTYLHCGKRLPNRSPLYMALVEPLPGDQQDVHGQIDQTETAGLHKVIQQLNHLKCPTPTNQLAEFEIDTINEIKLAIRMDCLAARRALIAKAMHQSQTVSHQELRQLRAQMRRMAEQFEQLWRKRNRPSRLGDNLKLFQKNDLELGRLLR